ncbi:beta-propeller fold lactonase family protein [Paenibacillus taichungensis]|uniref:Beta-propeller fold lactonase family protein n=1 Tax=Paenibacillus taichungensis TaxID=484184 RepID=A0ABX2MDZ6_9BACL|nr:tail fiber protein [Paenibacillus taichungensis]NUU53047.1 beta-propeller fold lactonase family protein [Paenibacillus taichungensis]
MLETMYPAAVNSRQTELATDIDDTQTSFTVLDGSVLPPAPNQLTLGTDESAETIKYTGKTGNEITGVTRGFEGAAKSWAAGTKLARYFTAYDHNTFKKNITDLDVRLNNIPAPEDASLTRKGIVQLSSATGSDSEGEAVTPKALNSVRKQADAKIGNLTELQTTDKDNLVDALNEVFTHVDEGKALVKTAVIVKGGTVAGTSPHSFQQLADGIDTIETATVISGQQQVTRTYAETIAVNDPVYTLTAFTNDTTIVDPPTTTGQFRGLSWSPDSKYFVAPSTSSPYISIYRVSGKSFTKLPNPSSLPRGSVNAATWSPDGKHLVLAIASSPYLDIYKIEGETFTKLPNPSVAPTGTPQDISFSPNGLYLAVGHTNSPYVTIYKRDGDTFTKLPNPAVLPPWPVLSVAWSPDSNYLVVGVNADGPFLTIYKRDGDTFTKLPNTAVLVPSAITALAFSPDGQHLWVGLNGAPYLMLYKRDGDTFTKLPDQQHSITSAVNRLAYDLKNQNLIVACGSSPFFIQFRRRGDVYIQNPIFPSAHTVAGRTIGFSADSNFVALGSNLVTIYSINYDNVFKSNNELLDLRGYLSEVGYALESGSAGDKKDIITIWR